MFLIWTHRNDWKHGIRTWKPKDLDEQNSDLESINPVSAHEAYWEKILRISESDSLHSFNNQIVVINVDDIELLPGRKVYGKIFCMTA